jgi:hypothetical protein
VQQWVNDAARLADRASVIKASIRSIHLESLRMMSRALSLAAVVLLIGGFAAEQATAQAQNLEAGKSPSQIFAGTCSACHKSPRGLLKTVAAGSLPGFLRQHYTTSPDMANVLSSFLVSNGANDARYGLSQKGGKDGAKDGAKDGTKDGTRETRSDAKPEARPDARSDARSDQPERSGRRQRSSSVNEAGRAESEPAQAAKPDDVETPQAEADRHGRKGRRMARPAVPPPDEAARPDADGQAPAQAREHAADGRKHANKQKLSKRSKPGGEDAARDRDNDPFREFFRERQKSEPAKDEPASVAPPASDSAKIDSGSADTATPAGESPPQAAKVEPPSDSQAPLPRRDPAPPTISAVPAPSASPAPASTAASSGGPDPVSTQSTAGSAPPPPAPPPVAAVPTPPPAPAVAPAGLPMPPVSQ